MPSEPSTERTRSRRRIRILIFGAWAVSIAWTVVEHNRFGDAREGLDMPLAWALFSIFAVIWASGLVVVIAVVGRATAKVGRARQVLLPRSLHHLIAHSSAVAAELASSRAFWWGWSLSWVGQALGLLVPAVAGVWQFGMAAAGLAGLAAINIITNVAWRVPLQLRLLELRAAAAPDPQPPPVDASYPSSAGG